MKALKITGIVLLVLVAIAAVLFFYVRYRLHHVKDRGDLEASLDKQVRKYIAKEQGYALVIGVYKDGRSFVKGYGSVIKGSSEPPSQDKVFQLASITKLFTASLLQILCDRGVVHLDDRIADLLHDKVILPPSAANTTLRHLATHTSGFPGLPQSFLDKMTDEANPYKDLRTEDLYSYLKTCEGKKPEGSFEYSNLGMGLLGHILALKAGGEYEQMVRQEILRPLGMNQTFVTIDSSNIGNIIQGYNEAGNPTPVWAGTVLTGAGFFLTTAQDMLSFIRANLDKTSPLYPTLAKTHIRQFDGKTALGWMVPDGFDDFIGSKSLLWHNGMVGGYATYIAIDTVSSTGLIMLSNRAKDITGDGSMLMRTINTQSWKH